MKKLVVTAKLLALASLLAGLSSCAMNIAADSTSRVEGLQKTTACAYWLFFERNAEVFCVVASTSIGERKPLNSRKVLREFWKSLFSAVGGRLISFDPYFSVPLVARETGGHGLSSSSSFAGR